MYDWGFNDVLKEYPFSGVFAGSPSAVGTTTMAYPGPVLALSANADQHGSGLLWATTQDPTSKAGILHAYDAENITSELWNSLMVPGRDGYGTLANYVPPLISNGKVYVASFYPGAIDAYGLLPYTVQPASLTFGTWQTNTSSSPQLVTVTNIGAAALSIASITFSGANPAAFSQTNTCGSPVAAGATCTISVVFKSTASGPSAATLNVNGAGGTGTQMVALSGSAAAPSYTVAPAALEFGSIATNTTSMPQSVMLTNASSAALPITSITLAGTNRALFSQTNSCGSSVPAVGLHHQRGIRANVRRFEDGDARCQRRRRRRHADGDAERQRYRVRLCVIARDSGLRQHLGKHRQHAAPGHADQWRQFGPAITSITLAGTNRALFSQTNTCGSSVPGGSSCTISVVFAPTSGGSKTATLDVNAGGGAGTQTVALTGTGTTSSYTISPTSLAFGSIAKNTVSAPLSVTVMNGGSAALSITSIALAGTNPAQFAQTNTCGSSVPRARVARSA